MYECPWRPCSGGEGGGGRYWGGDVDFPSRAEASQREKVFFNPKVEDLAYELNPIFAFSFRIPLLPAADVSGDKQ